MNQCGRCNATIRFGFFCNSCLSFFAGLAENHSAEPARSLHRLSAPLRQATARQLARGWHETVMVDRGLSIGLRTNDSKLLRDFFSCLAPVSDLSLAETGDHHYSIEARARAHGRRYALAAGNRKIGVVDTRAEAIMCVLSDLHFNGYSPLLFE